MLNAAEDDKLSFAADSDPSAYGFAGQWSVSIDLGTIAKVGEKRVCQPYEGSRE